MLSAVENFGPVPGPATALPYAHHHHHLQHHHLQHHHLQHLPLQPPPHQNPSAIAYLTTLQAHHLEQIQQQQQQLQQQQQQQQKEQNQESSLGYFLVPQPPPPPPPQQQTAQTTTSAITATSTTTPTTASVVNSSNIKSTKALDTNNTANVATSQSNTSLLSLHQRHQQQQQQQQQKKTQQREHQQSQENVVKSVMSINEFTQTQQHHQQQQQQHLKHPRNHNNNTCNTSNNNNNPTIAVNNNILLRSSNNLGFTLNGDLKHLHNNNNNNNLNHNNNNYSLPTTTANASTDQAGPMNLVTTQSSNYDYLSNGNNGNSPSISPLSSGGSHSHLKMRADNSRPPSSSSSSLDIENDNSHSPPVNIPLTNRYTLGPPTATATTPYHHKLGYEHPLTAEQSNAAAVAAAYQFDYAHLYASRAALYGAPVFSSEHVAHPTGPIRPQASYLGGMPAHPNEAAAAAFYFKALQNATSNLFNSQGAQVIPPLSSGGATQRTNLLSPPSAMHTHAPPSATGLLLPPPTPKTPISTNTTNVNLRQMTQHNEVKKSAEGRSFVGDSKGGATSTNTDGGSNGDGFFKVPNGKEGSLKHRILTRPTQVERSDASKNSVMRTYSTTSNFKKGSYIELSNGVLRRVEDMRTEDFIQCAERSPSHQLAESTVVRIDTTQGHTVAITFSYDKNRSKADIDVSEDHPFFVYGQGWASCNPEMSFKVFGLKCQRLQVGDICISLTSREPPPTAPSVNTSSTEQLYQQQPPQLNAERNEKLFRNPKSPSCHATRNRELPTEHAGIAQNLSPTTLMSPLSVPMPAPIATTQYPAVHNIPIHLLPSHHPYADMAEAISPRAQIGPDGLVLRNGSGKGVMMHHLSPKYLSGFYPQPQLIYHTPPHLSPNTDQHTEALSHAHLPGNAEGINQPIDASMSRKRRWSAPESIGEDELECHTQTALYPQRTKTKTGDIEKG